MLIIIAIMVIIAVLISPYSLVAPALGAKAAAALADKPVMVLVKDQYDIWIDKLVICESSGKETAVNWNDKGSPSYGLLQYKVGTFVFYAKRYNLFPYAETNEYFNFIYDGDIQRMLAKKMLQEDFDNWRHWTNCWLLMNLPEKLPLK